MTQPADSRRWKLLTGILTAALLIGGLTACRTTKQVTQSPDDFSGFLGDYSLLQKGDGNEANYIYINTDADWKKYTKVYIKNVELWKSDEPDSALGRLSPVNQQLLVNFMHTSLVDGLEKDFQIVDRPGPDTLTVSAAITEARKSRPVMNLVSSVVPMGIALSYTKQLITGSGTGVGLVMVEGEFTDSQNGQILCQVVDERAGTKALRTKFNSTWGDVKLAFDWWSQRLAIRAALFKQGDFSTDKL
jgi:Protein of unknown function (DUF3313)